MTKPNRKATPQSTTEENNHRELKAQMLPDGLYCIYFEGGGELPPELSGRYTSVIKAQDAINNYKIKRGY